MIENPAEEQLIAEWDEPMISKQIRFSSIQIILGSIILTAVLVAVGMWQQDSTYYFAAVAAIAGGGMLLSQKKVQPESRKVSLTTTRLIIGEQEYSLLDLAGFWLEHENEQLIVNVEPQKKSLFPITFYFSENNSNKAQEILNIALDEVEPRERTSADTLNKFLKL